MKYKKTLAFVVVLVLVLNLAVYSFATGNPTVFASDVNAAAGKVIFIPIQIKGNSGLMGFKITVLFDSDILIPRTVSRGSVTEQGMFENSIDTGEKTSFDIVWNNTSEIKEDGTLAVIGFTCSDKATGQTELKIGYSPEDTFNEKYENAALECKNGMIDFSGEIRTDERADRREVTPEDIVLAVETVQGDPQIKPTPAVMEAINSLLSQITGNPENYFTSPDEITGSYTEALKETFVEDVLGTVGEEKVLEIIQSALDLTGADSVESIQEDKQIDFINNVETAIKEELPDAKELSDYIPADDEKAIISGLFEEAKNRFDKDDSLTGKLKASFSEKKAVWIACIVAGIIAAAGIIFMVIRKIKKPTDNKGGK